ncbi:MAG: hypothetical protein L6R39_003216 [Caloplaca ligustica]|nr:MAG: hypothetical protein L6R39_003216 [Caloplaca ligustica]
MVDHLGPGDLLDPTDYILARQKAEAFERAILDHLGPAEPELLEVEQNIPMRDGHQHPIRITKPAHAPEGGSPLIICFHGGGFISGTIYNVAPYARGLAKLFGAVVVAPTYCLAPENPFPRGADDAWDAVRWVASHASSLSATPSQGFILSGGSAGANFVCVLAELAKTEKLEPPLTGLWSCMPVLFTEDEESRKSIPKQYQHLWFSRQQIDKTPILSNETARALLQYYRPDVRSPLWSPFNNTSAFEGLPPTFLQVCGRDIIRDDGLMYERMLRDHGCRTLLNVYAGLPHFFWGALPQLEDSRRFMVDIAHGFAWLLNREIDVAHAEKVMVFPQVE